MREHLTLKTLKQFLGYGAVGLLNTGLNFLLINVGIVITGATSGKTFILLSFVVFTILVFHSFVWNRYLIFVRDNPRELHREYIAFFSVTSFSALLNLLIIHIMVNIIGAPVGIHPHVWANVAIAVTIPTSVLINFLGYKFLVFKDSVV